MNPDGINAARPDLQPGEFYDALSDDVKKCFDAYGVQTYVQMLGVNDIPGPWFPMYSHSNNMTTATPGGVAWTRMGEIKHEYLPKVVLSSDFESAWNEYLEAYASAKPEDFLSEMQTEIVAEGIIELAGLEVRPGGVDAVRVHAEIAGEIRIRTYVAGLIGGVGGICGSLTTFPAPGSPCTPTPTT